jgi:hypothetical protein
VHWALRAGVGRAVGDRRGGGLGRGSTGCQPGGTRGSDDFVRKQFIDIIQWTEDRAVTAITLCLMVLPCAPALAMAGTLRTFHVAPTGSDVAAGYSTSPWRTLQKAAAAVQVGDLVIVRAGTYAGFDLWTSGTAANPIVFRADPGVVVNAPNPRTTGSGSRPRFRSCRRPGRIWSSCR